MRNSKPDVYAALLRVYPVVSEHTPDEDAALPCVTYRETDNADAAPGEDDHYLQREEYAIDVWGDQPEHDVSGIAIAVDAELKKLGFVRIHSFDLPRDESGAWHKNMIYERMI